MAKQPYYRLNTQVILYGCLWALGCLGLMVYLNGLGDFWILDDWLSIGPVHTELNSWPLIKHALVNNTTGPLGRPIAIAYFTFIAKVIGSTPVHYKLANISLHALNGLLVFWLSKQLRLPLAGLIALLWLWHPLHTSTVLYPVQGMCLLATFWMLLGLNAHLCLARTRPLFSVVIVMLCTLMAALSKEIGICLPVLIALQHRYVLQSTQSTPECSQLNQSTLLTKNPHWLSWVLVLGYLVGLGVYAGLQWESIVYRFPNYGISISERILAFPVVLLDYAWLTAFPNISHMGLLKGAPPYIDFLLHQHTWVLYGLWTGLLIFLGHGLFNRRANPLWIWFIAMVIAHVMEGTVFPLVLQFEHRHYLPSLFQLIFMALLLKQGLSHFSTIEFKTKPVMIIGLLLVWLGALYVRASGYASEGVFFTEAVRKHPESSLAQQSLGYHYAVNGSLSAARSAFEGAAMASPHDAAPVLRLLFLEGKHMESEIWLETIRNRQITPHALRILGDFLLPLGQTEQRYLSPQVLFKGFSLACQKNEIVQQPWLQAECLQYQTKAGLLANQSHETLMGYLDEAARLVPLQLSPLVGKVQLSRAMNEWDAACQAQTELLTHMSAHAIATPEAIQIGQTPCR